MELLGISSYENFGWKAGIVCIGGGALLTNVSIGVGVAFIATGTVALVAAAALVIFKRIQEKNGSKEQIKLVSEEQIKSVADLFIQLYKLDGNTDEEKQWTNDPIEAFKKYMISIETAEKSLNFAEKMSSFLNYIGEFNKKLVDMEGVEIQKYRLPVSEPEKDETGVYGYHYASTIKILSGIRKELSPTRQKLILTSARLIERKTKKAGLMTQAGLENSLKDDLDKIVERRNTVRAHVEEIRKRGAFVVAIQNKVSELHLAPQN